MNIDPLVRLAANAVSGERKYVLLAGAGLSKDAGQHTAWDIVLETAKLLRAATHDDSEVPIEEWFLSSQYASMAYADMISLLYENGAEQQAFLERVLNVRTPGRGHRAIAELCHRGVFRAIITTNFDTLLESALRERGIEPQIIASDADYQNVTPLIHCPTIRVYKPHGTLGTGRLRNTPVDVEALPTEISSELQRVFDDHGVIAIGYGGTEPGLMNVLKARRRNLYPVYWMHFEDAAPARSVEACANSLFSIKISGASAALENLIAIQDRLLRLSSTGASIDPSEAIRSIQEGRKDIAARVREFFSELTSVYTRLSPRPEELDSNRFPNCDETFLAALSATKPYMVQYTKLAAVVAEYDSAVACEAIRAQLHLLNRTYEPRRPGDSSPAPSSAFIKFLAQEMFVTQVACLVREERWVSLQTFLAGRFVGNNGHLEGWKEFNTFARILDEYRKSRLGLARLSVSRDVYEERHSAEDQLSELMPYQQLEEADWLLTFITGFMNTPGQPDLDKWFPRMSIEGGATPSWLIHMKKRISSSQILPLIKMDIENPHDLTKRELFFRMHFRSVAKMNQKLWTTGWPDELARFDKDIEGELFTVI